MDEPDGKRGTDTEDSDFGPTDSYARDVPKDTGGAATAPDCEGRAEPDAYHAGASTGTAPAEAIGSPESIPTLVGAAEAQTPGRADRWILAVGLVLWICVPFAGALVGDLVFEATFAPALAVPAFLIVLFAYPGRRRTWARVLAWVFAFAAVALSVVWEVVLVKDAFPGTCRRMHLECRQAVVFLSVAASVLCLAVWWRPVRAVLAKHIPFDSDDPVHTIALFVVFSVTVVQLTGLIVASEPLQLRAELMPGYESNARLDPRARSIANMAWTIPAVFVGVGYGLSRSFKACLERLGLLNFKWQHVAMGAGVGIAAAVVLWGMNFGVQGLWKALGWRVTVDPMDYEKHIEYMNLVGILVFGIGSGVPEELIFRGVIQPKLGILATNVFFTSVHAHIYGWDGLIHVFLAGLVFGWLRKKTSTWTAVMAHATDNMTNLVIRMLIAPQ